MKIIGHRGAAALAPENTLASFKKALQLNVDEVELDLRVTRDDVVVIHHDATLLDMAGSALLIQQTTLHELKLHKPDLLTFAEFAEQFGAPIPLIIEVKPAEPVEPIMKALADFLETKGISVANIAIASFDMAMLRRLHSAFPHVTIVVNEKWSGVRGSFRARQLDTKRISMNQKWLWRGFLRSMQRKGYQISPYTVNDPARAQKWRPYVYGIITDNPKVVSHTP